jgi:hypothetical protein
MDTETRTALKERARALRTEGLSYNEIHAQVPVSKSTLSLWLKDVYLTPEHRKRLYTKQIAVLSRGTPSQKERRKREIEAIISRASGEIAFPLSEDAYKLFGVALYWAEGSKGGSFEITNSDPRLILFMVRWVNDVFHIAPDMLKPRLNIYSQQDESAIKQFWSDLTGIPLENFGKSYVKPVNKGYKKNNLYYGTIKIYVPKGTDLLHIVYGWHNAVLQKIEDEIQLTERKWISLKETPRPVNLPENNLPL